MFNVLILLLSVSPASLQKPVPILSVEQFGAASTEQRQSTLLDLSRHVPGIGTAAIPLISAGLEDPDPQVRFLAAGVLSELVLLSRRREGASVALELRQNEAVRALAVRALRDGDHRVRATAVTALEVTAPNGPDEAEAVMTAYATESVPHVRAHMLTSISKLPCQTAGRAAAVMQGLTDSEPPVKRAAAGGVAKCPAPAALPLVVQELRVGSADTRPNFVPALVAFGPSARPHAGVLKELLLMETRTDIRDQIVGALEALK